MVFFMKKMLVMEMLNKLKPDFYFDSYQDIKIEWLKQKGIRTLLCDLDGTLAKQDEMPDAYFDRWFETLEENDIAIILISNNKTKRVRDVTRKYQIVGFGDCHKPSTRKIDEEIIFKGLNTDKTILVGDQLFTDILVSKKLNMRSILVNPIPGVEPFRTKVKRPIERVLKLLIKKEF